MPVNVHGGTGVPDYGPYPVSMLLYINEAPFYSQRPLVQFILSGIFERFPRLKFVVTESGCAWVPPLLKRLDRVLARIRDTGRHRRDPLRRRARPATSRPPSTSTRTCGWASASPVPPTPPPATRSASTSSCGAATTPTTRAPAPFTREHLRALFHDTDPAELRRLLAGNAAELYGFDLDALAPLADAVRPDRRRDRHAAHRAAARAQRGAAQLGRGLAVSDGGVRRRGAAARRTGTPARPPTRPASRWSSSTTRPPASGASRSTGPRSATPSTTRCGARCIAALRAADGDDARAGHHRARRRHVLLGRLRPGRRQRGHRAAVLHRRRRGPVAPPRHRGLDVDLGPGQAGHRPGARLLPGRRVRAGHRVRPRLRRRRTPRSATRPCASARPTCSSTPGSWACGRPWR